MAVREEEKLRWPRLRARIVFVLLALWVGGVAFRAAQLTVYADERVDEFSSRQGVGSIEIDLPRGMIYDTLFNELAVSVDMESIYLNPRTASDPAKVAARLAALLAPQGGEGRRALFRRLKRRIETRSGKSFVWIARKAAPELVAAVKKADIAGVGYVTESKRFYPKRDIAARIIGFCGIDNQGLYGLEYRYDDVIRPVASRFTVLRDALGRPLSMPDAVKISDESQPVDLTLTVDERIQYVAEKALERQVAATGALRGVAIVMDPYTGAILAISEQPKFNANNFGDYDAAWWKSMAVSRVVEPGSTFKIFVAAAALEEGVVEPYEKIDCERGRYTVGDHTFKEALWRRYDHLTMAEVIEKSSNIGAIKIAQRLGEERLYRYLTAFGFGEKSGVDLPGEATGLLRPVKEWWATSLPSLSFGQEVGVTPIQMIAGVSAIANGGWLMRPHVVKGFAREGRMVETVTPTAVRRVVSGATARRLTEMMERVVTDGTGKRAAVAGYRVAGKSGTAQKIDPATNGYSNEKFLSSFVGFFPADRPRLAVLVMIDEPKGDAWGGAVAGPVFAEIAERSARILRIPSERTEVYEIDWSRLTGAGAV